MKILLRTILGAILLFPIRISDAFGIDIDTFRKEVFRPDNLPAGTAAKDAPVETKINFILDFAINLILYASGAAAVLLLIISGIQYISSMGNQERMDAAKKTMKYALIGIFVVIFAYAIVTNIVDLIFRATI